MPKHISQQLEIAGIPVTLLQKRIKNLHLRIYPPHGEVRISAPLRLDFSAIKKFFISKINWIQEKQIKIRGRKFVAPLKFISGENHYFFGKKYLLEVIENSKSQSVILHDDSIRLYLKKKLTLTKRRKILDDFYRAKIKKTIPQFIEKYEKKMDVKVAEFGVKKMKTRWGTCNPKARRIWLNLELAKRPIACLEFIIVHELTHLLERKHNKRFFALMDQFLPQWRVAKDQLKQTGLKIG